MNTFGNKLRVTTFGESHGPAMGGIIDGFPSGFRIDFDKLREEISRRAPGKSVLATQRQEKDEPEFLSGISPEGITYGTPIGFIVRNVDNRGKDYSDLENKYRPNHADYVYDVKYGLRDHRGGGRASARETVNWVVAGTLALQWLEKTWDIKIEAVLSGAGQVNYSDTLQQNLSENPFEASIVIPEKTGLQIEEEIRIAKNAGDSVGGTVTCLINNMPNGLGEPIFDKLNSRLAQAMMTINAVKGFEIGSGFKLSSKRGSETLDIFSKKEEDIITLTNHSGGIQGGISNGLPVFFNVYFKPTPTIMQEIPTIDKMGNPVTLKMKGRHDPCVALRGVEVVKAMAALVIADFLV